MNNDDPILSSHRVGTDEEWLEVRRSLLREEKEAMKRHDEFTKRQREFPWRVTNNYVFTTTTGDVSLGDLFEGRVNFSLSFEHHYTSYVAVGRAPIDQIEAVRLKMDWKFKWVSSSKSDLNYDFHLSFRPDELAKHRATYNFREFDPKGSEDLSGNSIFYKDKNDQVFHTYSTFGRGGEQFLASGWPESCWWRND